jgi:hypothetical protein
MIRFRCPGTCRCGTPCSVEDVLGGSTIACPHSGTPIRVPARSFTANDWANSVDPQEMLFGLPELVPNRKLRLFALACCQRIAVRLSHPLSKQALLLAERCAEEIATEEEMRTLAQQFMNEYNARLAAVHGNWQVISTADLDAAYSMTLKVFPASVAFNVAKVARDIAEEQSHQCCLLHCIFGNPFDTPIINSAWLSCDVNNLAQGIYAEGAFDRMPILGDALEEAGCANADILNHCRQPGEHVRGCWVVDLLLGKQ